MENVQSQSNTQDILAAEAASAAQAAGVVEKMASVPRSAVTQTDVRRAQLNSVRATEAMNAATVAPAFRSSRPGSPDDNGTFNMFEVNFRISAPETHENAYGVLRLLVRDPESPR